MKMVKAASASALAGALLLGAAGVEAAPMPTHAAFMSSQVSSAAVDVYWRRWGWGGVGLGLFAGALVGSAIANSYYDGYGYGYAYPYGNPYYAPYPYYAASPCCGGGYGYGYRPYYRAYGYGYGPHYHGYVRWHPHHHSHHHQ